ncbi:Mismatch repair ATPase (MutS family) [Halapricum desulfuricans]|uniref:DNA mismatch repair protein MutS n=1 Tax=Halapricum desulfuricans TaxID=2841257 RepID=A0A897NPZ9_9EURY|nr:DNA mismatch repair protein MutS [Halapricum desulfuricans]QSG12933.1 Mismatch repair ATPase (MutS family) [Halapricum desulfuricans]
MSEATGIVGEFFDLKAETDADILAMQVGDFYEFFDSDAELVADELDLKVSQKSSHGSSYPMAGVPVDELTPYLKALVERGYRVAVADQREAGDGHEREITRVVSPGTLLEVTDADARYLLTIVHDAVYGLAFTDVTTGRFHVTTAADADELLTTIYRFDPVEILPGPDVRNDDDLLERLRGRTDAALTLHTAEAFAPGRARHRVREQFGEGALESVGVEAAAAVRAAGAVLSYVEETGQGVLASITRLQAHGDGDHVELDATTQRNLELTETMQGDRSGSLFETIDHTVTSAGGRLLKSWLQRPRRDRAELQRRQSAVAALAEAALARDRLREVLGDAYDLERLASKAASGSADARDLVAARETLSLLPTVREIVADTDRLADSTLGDVLDRADLDRARELRETLEAALVEEPPGTVTQGGLIREGFDEQLDELIERNEAIEAWLDELPKREKRRHGITHLSVDRNKTDGYYIQVGKSETDAVPDSYEQIKTLKNSERYTIDELEEQERELLRIEEQRHDLERRLFEEIREAVAAHAELLQDVGRALAAVDAFAGLATHAVRADWTRPELTDDDEISIAAGRHPVVERTTEFVPNDVRMDRDRRFLVVTGPNMSGKSTYMRQTALITLLAQVGSFVPARQARIGLVDGIYTRVGALDELAQGRSTFMVEMQELSNILHSASDESLVILDEVGRGTATFDGISIAWAATEYLVNEVGAKTLFATHYHELTELGDQLDPVRNVHVAVDGDPDSDGEEVTFLRTVREGPADRSYGVHVADLAGVPQPVVERSREVLDRLRNDEAIDVRGASSGTTQAVFDLSSGQFRGERDGSASADGGSTEDSIAEQFGEDADEVLEALSDLDVDETAPVELLSKVQGWQDRLEGP